LNAFTIGPAAALGSDQGFGQAVSRSGITPVIDSNFADPEVLLVNGVYHAYATNSGGDNIQHETSMDLVHWTARPDVAPVLGDWVGECSFAPGGPTDHCVWAPEVTAVPGGYALYYTARDNLAPRQCIGLSFSTSPDGPFVPVGSDPLVCPDGQRGTADLGGAIDASTYQENGQLYLLWKADGNCCRLPATIFIQPLSSDGRTLTGPPTELIRNDQRFEGAVVEAPTLVKHDGTYYLFYSANDFGGGNYRTGYATSSTITGPYVKSDTELMTTDLFHGTVIGPGGQDVVTNSDGSTSIVFHGWDPTYSYRAMYASALDWSRTVTRRSTQPTLVTRLRTASSPTPVSSATPPRQAKRRSGAWITPTAPSRCGSTRRELDRRPSASATPTGLGTPPATGCRRPTL
jgi:arabinan endo-1,5-alpha-L-arabinosidase